MSMGKHQLESDDEDPSAVTGCKGHLPAMGDDFDDLLMTEQTETSVPTVDGDNKPSTKRKGITNSDIMMKINSMETRIKKIEDAMGEIIRKLDMVLQSSPTFISSGTSGNLTMHQQGMYRNKIIKTPPM